MGKEEQFLQNEWAISQYFESPDDSFLRLLVKAQAATGFPHAKEMLSTLNSAAKWGPTWNLDDDEDTAGCFECFSGFRAFWFSIPTVRKIIITSGWLPSGIVGAPTAKQLRSAKNLFDHLKEKYENDPDV